MIMLASARFRTIVVVTVALGGVVGVATTSAYAVLPTVASERRLIPPSAESYEEAGWSDCTSFGGKLKSDGTNGLLFSAVNGAATEVCTAP